MKATRNKELTLLKLLLWIYLILCLVIAGLNFGYVPKASPAEAKLISTLWHLYENEFKSLLIVVGSLLTLRVIGKSNRNSLRKANLIGITLSALVVHIIGPLIIHNQELYFFTMPLPWTTTPLQFLYPASSIYVSRVAVWGLAGVSTALLFYVVVSVIIIIGTLFLGRRWQCSTLCLFNGFASEVFAPVTPLLGRKRIVNPRTLLFLSMLRWVFFGMALLFTLYWIFFLLGYPLLVSPSLLSRIEVYKYLSAELLMMMFLWVIFSGRGYCYYCPLGTTLALLSKLSKQHIATNKSHCTKCNCCNIACPMTIDIRSKASLGLPVTDLRCVGCGHCVDVCPTKTLSYQTKFYQRS